MSWGDQDGVEKEFDLEEEEEGEGYGIGRLGS